MLPLELSARRMIEAVVIALIGLALAGACLPMLGSSASAANFTWTGASTTSHDWSNGENWGGTAPSGTVGTLEFPQLTSVACTTEQFETTIAACYETANDISGLDVSAISLDGPYTVNDPLVNSPPGEGITLGAGGLTVQDEGGAGSLEGINIPIALSAPQTWSLNGGAYFGGSIVGGETGLDLDIRGGGNIDFNGSVETGPVTATGSNAADTGESAMNNGTVWIGADDPASTKIADINGESRGPVTINDAALGANEGGVGPLTLEGGEIVFGLLGAGPKLAVVGGATFDASSALQMTINASSEATNASEVEADGAIDLGGSHLSLSTRFGSGECNIPVGHVYTLLSAADALEGTFNGLPDGSTVALQGCDAPQPELRINYTTHTVTATVVEATAGPPVEPVIIATPPLLPAGPVTNEGAGSGGATGARIAQPEPVPVLAQSQAVNVTAGTVTVRVKGTTRFVALSGTSTIPNGSEVETTNGRVVITAATPIPGRTVSASIYGGRFLIQQDHSGSGETHLGLSLPLTGCPRVTLPRGSAATLAASAARSSGSKSRKLWVSDNGGSWGTNGRYVSTTVEGTHWLTVDECNQSLVTVAAGKVKVRDLVHDKTKILTAGKTYVATR